MRVLLDERGLSYRALAARTYFSKSYLQELATGKKPPTVEAAAALVLVGGTAGAYTAEYALRAYRYARSRPRPERGWVAPMAFALAGTWSAGVAVDSTVWRFAALCWLTAALIRWARR